MIEFAAGTKDVVEFNTASAIDEIGQIQWMKVGGIPVFSIWSSSFSLQTVLYSLLKLRSVNTERCIGRCWNPSSIVWTIDMDDPIFTASTLTKTSLESTKRVVSFSNIV